jgi:hypothetical protein
MLNYVEIARDCIYFMSRHYPFKCPVNIDETDVQQVGLANFSKSKGVTIYPYMYKRAYGYFDYNRIALLMLKTLLHERTHSMKGPISGSYGTGVPDKHYKLYNKFIEYEANSIAIWSMGNIREEISSELRIPLEIVNRFVRDETGSHCMEYYHLIKSNESEIMKDINLRKCVDFKILRTLESMDSILAKINGIVMRPFNHRFCSQYEGGKTDG